MKRYRLIYAFVLAGAAAFSQFYMGHLSLALLITAAALPFASLLLALISRFALKVKADLSPEIYEKDCSFQIRIFAKNRFFIPIAPALLSISMPDPSSDTDEGSAVFSLGPFQGKSLNLSYRLSFRGCYIFTVKEVVMYDFLRIFRFKKRLKLQKEIVVLPKRIELLSERSLSSDSEEGYSGKNSPDGTELSFIRKYADGDDFRKIHWKLSSKQEDYMVRQMTLPSKSGMTIYCDFTAYSVNGVKNAANIDRVVEAALAVMSKNVRMGEEAVCIWYSKAESDCRVELVSDGVDLNRLWNDFARAEVYSGAPPFSEIVASCAQYCADGSFVCVVTPKVDRELEKMLERMSAVSNILLALADDPEESSLELLKNNRKVAVCELGEDLQSSLDSII